MEIRMAFALIFAGGVGTRMDSKDVPKQFLKVDGIPIIIRTISHFEKHEQVDGSRGSANCSMNWRSTGSGRW